MYECQRRCVGKYLEPGCLLAVLNDMGRFDDHLLHGGQLMKKDRARAVEDVLEQGSLAHVDAADCEEVGPRTQAAGGPPWRCPGT